MDTFANDPGARPIRYAQGEEDSLDEMSESDWEAVRQDTFWEGVQEDIEMEALDEADGIDDHECDMGHRNCYDNHTVERLSDEADWEEMRERER